MPKELVLTGLGNKIEYATTNGKGLITGKREDLTDNAIRVVFEHMMREFNRRKKNEPEREKFGYAFEGFGTLYYIPEED